MARRAAVHVRRVRGRDRGAVSSRAGAFRADHQRLLESLALQIAAALQNAHLYELAMVDGLTGLFMRRYFDARIEEEIERSKRYGTPFSVVMMDVDDFKKLNDEHGHLIGDRVLRAIANVVKAQMRGVDTAARYGGEEIARDPAAHRDGRRLQRRRADPRGDRGVARHHRRPIRRRRSAVTASFGIASYPESKAADRRGSRPPRRPRALSREEDRQEPRRAVLERRRRGPCASRCSTAEPD